MKKKTIFNILIGLAVLVIAVLILNVLAKQQLKTGIEEEFGDALVYEKIRLNLLRGNLSFQKSVLTLENARIATDEIEVVGFSYFNYFKQDKIIVERLSLSGPEIVFYEQRPDTSDTSEKFEDDILIRSFELSGGSISLSNSESKEKKLFVQMDRLHLSNVGVNENSIQQEIPFTYNSYEAMGDSLFLDLDEEHYLSLGNLELADGVLLLENLTIIPKYSVEEFDQRIPYEKDRFELQVERIATDSLSWGFINDSLLLRNHLLQITGADLEVYRNKLLPDDTRKKTLYSEKIREAPIKMNFEKVEIDSSHIVYRELIHEDRGPGVVEFTNLNARIDHISNLGLGQTNFRPTQVEAQANMMGEGLLTVDWEFDISNVQEEFRISGTLGSVSAEGINSFLKPATNVEAEGGIQSLAFNFYGNDDTARGDMRLQYKDFRVRVLRDDGRKKSGFLTSIVNLFINKDSLNEESHQEDLEITRDKEKSFWNFLWKSIEAGAIKAVL